LLPHESIHLMPFLLSAMRYQAIPIVGFAKG
jgi:hypothetical protein